MTKQERDDKIKELQAKRDLKLLEAGELHAEMGKLEAEIERERDHEYKMGDGVKSRHQDSIKGIFVAHWDGKAHVYWEGNEGQTTDEYYSDIKPDPSRQTLEFTEEDIRQAHMAGQAFAGSEPSYSETNAYLKDLCRK